MFVKTFIAHANSAIYFQWDFSIYSFFSYRNGDLFTAVNCVEKVMEECKNDNTDAAYYFRKMVDIEKNRRAIRYFCTNIRGESKNIHISGVRLYALSKELCIMSTKFYSSPRSYINIYYC